MKVLNYTHSRLANWNFSVQTLSDQWWEPMASHFNVLTNVRKTNLFCQTYNIWSKTCFFCQKNLLLFFYLKKSSFLMRKLDIYGNTENQAFGEVEVFFWQNENYQVFSREPSISEKPINWSEKPDFSGRNQKFLLQILKYRKTKFFWFRKTALFCLINARSFEFSNTRFV